MYNELPKMKRYPNKAVFYLGICLIFGVCQGFNRKFVCHFTWKFKSWAGKLLKIWGSVFYLIFNWLSKISKSSLNKRYSFLSKEFENEKKKKKEYDFPEKGFEPQIFSNFPAHDLSVLGKWGARDQIKTSLG